MADDVGQHPIFLHNPEEWMQYMYKLVSVTTTDGQEHLGWVHTIDPVSQTVCLVQFAEGRHSLELLPGHNVKHFTVVNDNAETHRETLDSLLRPAGAGRKFSPQELQRRQLKVKTWLEKNRLPVTVAGANGELLTITDALVIEPPYDANSCRSTNEIILGRIQGLITNMPPDQDEW